MKRIICAILIFSVVLSLCGCGNSSDNTTDIQANKSGDIEGFVSVEEFEAYPSDGEDDTEAIKAALATGKNVYLLKGEYILSDTIVVNNQQLVGAGDAKTNLVSHCEDKTKPVIDLNGDSRITDIGISYKTELITYDEKEGERVAIYLGGKEEVTTGASIENVLVRYVGTAVYGPEASKGYNNLLIDTCLFPIVSYSGVHFAKKGMYGNSLSNVYIGANVELSKARKFGVYVLGQNNLTIGQLNLEHLYFDDALLIRDCDNVTVESLHMEAIGQSKAGTANVFVENSDVTFNAMTLYYNPVDYNNCSVLQLGNGNNNDVNIGVLHLKGLNNVNASNGKPRADGLNNPDAAGHKIISRKSGSKGEFNVNISSYVWYTWCADVDKYASFPCDNQGINYISKGIR